MASGARDNQGQELATADRGAGRAAVREYLIAPLAGLARQAGHTVERHKREMDKLVDRLAYLPELTLRGLAELVMNRAGLGKGRPVWPSVETVIAWAHAIEAPPPLGMDYVRSVMRSTLGARARDGGWMVELFRMARRYGPPPSAYLVHKLKEQARDNKATQSRIVERMRAGASHAEDRQWMMDWHNDYSEARAMVDAGAAVRAVRQCEGIDRRMSKGAEGDGA